MSPLLGFTPDADATTPGVITDCDHFIPYESGMQGAPSPVSASVDALADECRNAAVLTLLSGVRRVFAGTEDALYELGGATWTDVSRVGGYAGGAETRWSFAQFGDDSLASNRVEPIQFSNTSGNFADISGAPSALVIFSVGAFVMALNVNDGADKPDGWHCCAANDASDWVESVSTQCASGRLVSSPGPLTNGARLGEYAVAYKAGSMFLGQYVGAPSVWDWLPVPGGNAGCIGQDALCDVNGTHFFVGEDNFWSFDGTKPVPVGDKQVRQWFFNNSDPTYRYKTKCVFDRQNNRIHIYYPSKGSDECDSSIVYHIVSKQWGLDDVPIEAVLNYVVPGITIDGLTALSSTITGLPDIPYDSQYWLAGGRALSVFNTSHELSLMTGACVACDFTTGDAGDDDQVSFLRQIRLRYAAGAKPTTATVTNYYKMNEGDALTLGASGSINDGKFDCRQSARFHRAQFDFTGDVKVTAIRADFVAAGMR